MTYKLTDEDLEIVRVSLELAKKRAALPDDQRVLLDSPKFNGPIGRLDDDDAAAPPSSGMPDANEGDSSERVETPCVSDSKP